MSDTRVPAGPVGPARPEFVRETRLDQEFGVVEKPLTVWEKLYNQTWLRKALILAVLALLWQGYSNCMNAISFTPMLSIPWKASPAWPGPAVWLVDSVLDFVRALVWMVDVVISIPRIVWNMVTTVQSGRCEAQELLLPTFGAAVKAAWEANPDAVILYKPHPDVEAGLRPGAIPEAQALAYADAILTRADIAALLPQVDEVWTMTSLTGFEALIRGKRVTTLGAPFYAGWGLTTDLGPVPRRRLRRDDGSLLPRPDLAHLIHAALIAYPRYWDPVSRRPCPPEVALQRLAEGTIPRPGPLNRLLAKLQGRFASHARLWR